VRSTVSKTAVMSLGPVPRVGAHAFRHPMSARESHDNGPLIDRSKRPPVPRTERAPKVKQTAGALAREQKKFGLEPNCLSGSERSRPRSIDGRIGGSNVMQQYFGRKNNYDRELKDPGNQVFEWGPERQELEKNRNHGRAAIMDREQKICGGASWFGPQEVETKLTPGFNAKFHGRANTIMNEIRSMEKAKKDDEEELEVYKPKGRVSVLKNENKGPQQLAGDPVDTSFRLGMY